MPTPHADPAPAPATERPRAGDPLPTTPLADTRPDHASADSRPDPVPWLDEEQQRWWRSYMTGSLRLSEALSRQLEHDAGLSLHEYEVMVRLSEAPDRTIRMAELAASLVHSRSRLTHTVTRMEGRGLVERRACAADGRGINAVLTDLGYRTLVDAAPGHVRAVREHLVDRLSRDQLRAVGEAMDLVAPDAGPPA